MTTDCCVARLCVGTLIHLNFAMLLSFVGFTFRNNDDLLFLLLLPASVCAELHLTVFVERRSVRCEPWPWICSLRPCTVRPSSCSRGSTTAPAPTTPTTEAKAEAMADRSSCH